MKTPNSNRNIPVRKALKLGDPALWYGFMNSPVWKLLFTKFGQAMLFLLKRSIRANGGIQAYIITTIKGCKPGILVSGIGLTLTGSSMMLVYNSSHVWDFFDALFSFSWPDLSVWKNWDWNKAHDFTVISIKSQAVLGFNILFSISSLTHTLINYLGFGTDKISKRSTSYLYLLLNRLLSKWIVVGEFFINLLETVLVLAGGIALIYYKLDAHFGYLLISVSVNELIILITDKAATLYVKPFFDK